MEQSVSRKAYSPAVITLHWAMFILIAAVFASIEFRELFEKGSVPREFLKSLHFMLGLCVLILVVLRLFTLSRTVTPAIQPQPAAWETAAAHVAHLALYAIMLAMPILGWLTLSAAGKPIPFFGLTLPPLIAASKETAEWLKEVHHQLGEIFYIVIGLHAAAALAHHYFFKDNTLKRMLPERVTR